MPELRDMGSPSHGGARARTGRPHLLIALVVCLLGCTEEARPAGSTQTSGFDLGRDAFGQAGTDDAADDIDDVTDGADDVDSSVILGEGDPCDVLADACPSGLKCELDLFGEGVCARLLGDGAEGESCGSDGVDDCARGLLCYDPGDGTGLRCRVPCDPAAATGCPGGRACGEPIRWSEQALGMCALP